PGPGDLAAGLLEDDPAALVLDGRGALLPLDLVEGADALGAEASRHDHPPARAPVVPPLPGRFPMINGRHRRPPTIDCTRDYQESIGRSSKIRVRKFIATAWRPDGPAGCLGSKGGPGRGGPGRRLGPVMRPDRRVRCTLVGCRQRVSVTAQIV